MSGHLHSAPGFEPPGTTADERALAAEADRLDALAGRVSGHGAQLRSALESGAAQFSELVSDGIRRRGDASVEATRQATAAAYYGATVLRALSDEVYTFRNTIDALVERWLAAQSADDTQRAELHAELMAAARTARDRLDDAADEHGALLASGPTPATLRRLTEAGFIGWAAFNLFGDNNIATEKAIERFRAVAGRRLSGTELAELTTVMKEICRDPQAAGRLLVQLRPAGLLRAWGRLVRDGDASPGLQNSLSRLLALGTRPGPHAVSANWRGRLLTLAAGPVSLTTENPDAAPETGPVGGARTEGGAASESAERIPVAATAGSAVDTTGDSAADVDGVHSAVDDSGAGGAGVEETVPGGALLAPLLEDGRFDRVLLLGAAEAIFTDEPLWTSAALSPLSPAHPTHRPVDSLLWSLGGNPDAAAAFFTDPHRMAALESIPSDPAARERAQQAAEAARTAATPPTAPPEPRHHNNIDDPRPHRTTPAARNIPA